MTKFLTSVQDETSLLAIVVCSCAEEQWHEGSCVGTMALRDFPKVEWSVCSNDTASRCITVDARKRTAIIDLDSLG